MTHCECVSGPASGSASCQVSVRFAPSVGTPQASDKLEESALTTCDVTCIASATARGAGLCTQAVEWRVCLMQAFCCLSVCCLQRSASQRPASVLQGSVTAVRYLPRRNTSKGSSPSPHTPAAIASLNAAAATGTRSHPVLRMLRHAAAIAIGAAALFVLGAAVAHLLAADSSGAGGAAGAGGVVTSARLPRRSAHEQAAQDRSSGNSSSAHASQQGGDAVGLLHVPDGAPNNSTQPSHAPKAAPSRVAWLLRWLVWRQKATQQWQPEAGEPSDVAQGAGDQRSGAAGVNITALVCGSARTSLRMLRKPLCFLLLVAVQRFGTARPA